MRIHRFAVACLTGMCAFVPSVPRAQTVPRTITGVVHDTLGRPLQNAVIALDPSGESRATRADAEGRFRFEKVSPGRHELRTAWLGYRPDERVVEVPAAGLAVTIELTPLPYQLDTLTISARRTGIFGTTVVHADLRPLGGADVEVLGTQWRVRTGADGRFSFPDLREGAYIVEARRDGFKSRLIPAAVPPEKAVELAMVLDSLVTKRDRIAEHDWRALESRSHWASRAYTAFVPRQELSSHRGQPLDIALRFAPSYLVKGFLQADQECIFVDGRPRPGARLGDFLAEDVAMVEVYAGRNIPPPAVPWPRGFPCAMGTPKAIGPAAIKVVYVWLKH